MSSIEPKVWLRDDQGITTNGSNEVTEWQSSYGNRVFKTGMYLDGNGNEVIAPTGANLARTTQGTDEIVFGNAAGISDENSIYKTGSGTIFMYAHLTNENTNYASMVWNHEGGIWDQNNGFAIFTLNNNITSTWDFPNNQASLHYVPSAKTGYKVYAFSWSGMDTTDMQDRLRLGNFFFAPVGDMNYGIQFKLKDFLFYDQQLDATTISTISTHLENRARGSIVEAAGPVPPPAVDIFFTNHLDESIQALSLTIPTIAPTLTNIDATVVITGVPVASLRETFYFKTDTPIATDATDDVLCYVDTSKWATMATNLDASTGTISAVNGAFVDADIISKDFLRNVANGLFGTYLGVDLFTNETSIRQDMETKTAALATTIKNTIGDVGIAGLDNDLLGPDADGHKYLDDTVSGTKNVTLALLMQFLQHSPERFSGTNFTNLQFAGKTGYYKMPFQTGDSVSYAVTINPHENQNTNVNTGSNASARRYRVKLVLA